MSHQPTAISIVESICLGYPQVIAAYLFGSHSKGNAGSRSDVDLAVLVREPSVDFPLLKFIIELEESFVCPVDVVVLNRAGELLKYHVRRDGKLLFDRDSRTRKNFEIRSRKYFEDFRYLHNRYIKKAFYGDYRG